MRTTFRHINSRFSPKRILIYSFLVIGCLKNFGQEISDGFSDIIENEAEKLSGDDENIVDDEAMQENLEYLKANPVNLNTATVDDLRKIPTLTDFQIKSLLDYRLKMGKINSIYELNYVYGFTPEVTRQIKPFVTIDASTTFNAPHHVKSGNELLLRSIYKNNSDATYLGSPLQLYTRIKGNSGDKINYGFLAEKDAGEEFGTGLNKQGFDFYSGFLQLHPSHYIKSITLGDYRVQCGQGLLIWNGYGSSGYNAISIQKRAHTIKGNSSKNEYNFLRGVAMETVLGNFSASVFSSKKQLDGIPDSIDGILGIKSISETGYHRTTTEILRKENTSESIFGTMLEYHNNTLRFGINAIHTKYSRTFLTQETPYKSNNFTGSSCTGFSANYTILLHKIQFYGEAAYSNNSLASINGINLLVNSGLIASIIFRNYPKTYFSPYSGAFTTNTNNQNEKGTIIGLKWQSPWGVNISAYSNYYSFPWLSYSADKPVSGSEKLAECTYLSRDKFALLVRFTSKQRNKNNTDINLPLEQVQQFNKYNLRLQGRFYISSVFRMTMRYEFCRSKFGNSLVNDGNLVFCDFSYQQNKNRIISFRYTIFDIDDYESRIYTYENDVLYSFTVPAFSGNGQKFYIMCHQKLTDKISFWLRYEYLNNFNSLSKNKTGISGQLILKW